jgi:hypothetical protein
MIYMDPLEKFVQENRKFFDTDRPGLPVWANIEKGLIARRKPRIKLIWKVAASVALLLTIGGVAGFYLSLQLNSPSLAESALIQEELIQAVSYYHQEIDQRLEEVKMNNIEPDVIDELDQLDMTIAQLKEDLKFAPANSKETIFNAVIQAYESKLEILERFINGQNQYNELDHEGEYLKL